MKEQAQISPLDGKSKLILGRQLLQSLSTTLAKVSQAAYGGKSCQKGSLCGFEQQHKSDAHFSFY